MPAVSERPCVRRCPRANQGPSWLTSSLAFGSAPRFRHRPTNLWLPLTAPRMSGVQPYCSAMIEAAVVQRCIASHLSIALSGPPKGARQAGLAVAKGSPCSVGRYARQCPAAASPCSRRPGKRPQTAPFPARGHSKQLQPCHWRASRRFVGRKCNLRSPLLLLAWFLGGPAPRESGVGSQQRGEVVGTHTSGLGRELQLALASGEHGAPALPGTALGRSQARVLASRGASQRARPAAMAGSFSGFIPKLSASAELVWMGLKPFAAAGFAVLVGERMAAYKVSKAHHGHGHEHGHVSSAAVRGVRLSVASRLGSAASGVRRPAGAEAAADAMPLLAFPPPPASRTWRSIPVRSRTLTSWRSAVLAVLSSFAGGRRFSSRPGCPCAAGPLSPLTRGAAAQWCVDTAGFCCVYLFPGAFAALAVWPSPSSQFPHRCLAAWLQRLCGALRCNMHIQSRGSHITNAHRHHSSARGHTASETEKQQKRQRENRHRTATACQD